MKRIALSVSYPHWPVDEADQARIAKYLAAIIAGGGEPTALYLDEWENRAQNVVDEFDGLVIAGGADLPTDWYGETPLPNANLELVSARRPNFEKQIVGDFETQQKPVLGICYGCQFLNVYRGGSLVQDVELQLAARPNPEKHTDGYEHLVQVERDSRLFGFVDESEFPVPSYHHQALGRLAPGARVSSWARDGVIESVEWPDEPFFLGVQWHPERAPESNATRKLMRAFVDAC